MHRRIVPAVGLLAVLLAAAGQTSAQERENPLIARVRAQVKSADKPFTLVIRVTVKEGAGERLEAAFARSRRETRKEKGNVAYDLCRDTQNPSRYLVYERWTNLKALEDHIKSDYVRKLLAEMSELTAGAPESLVLVPAGE